MYHLDIGVFSLIARRLVNIGGIGGPPVFASHRIDLIFLGRFFPLSLIFYMALRL